MVGIRGFFICYIEESSLCPDTSTLSLISCPALPYHSKSPIWRQQHFLSTTDTKCCWVVQLKTWSNSHWNEWGQTRCAITTQPLVLGKEQWEEKRGEPTKREREKPYRNRSMGTALTLLKIRSGPSKRSHLLPLKKGSWNKHRALCTSHVRYLLLLLLVSSNSLLPPFLCCITTFPFQVT